MNTLNKIDNALKMFYLDPMSECLNTIHPFLSVIERTSDDVWGKYIKKLVKLGDKYEVLTLELKNLYGTIELSEKAIRASANNEGAMVNLINSEMQELLLNTKSEISSNLFKSEKISGFDYIFQNGGNIYGLNRDDYPQLMPCIKEDFGDLTEEKLEEVIRELDQRPDFIITSFKIGRYFKTKLDSHTVELNNGSIACFWNDMMIVSDANCPDDTIYLLNSHDFSMHQLCDWRWLEGEDGTILKRHVTKPIYTATIVKYADLMCKNPSHQAMLTGVESNKEKKDG